MNPTEKNTPRKNLLFSFLILLIAGGTLAAVTGIYVIDDQPDTMTEKFESNHDFDISEWEVQESKPTIYGVSSVLFLQEGAEQAIPAAERGVTVGELMRWAGIIAILVALAILLVIEFVYKDQINRMNYRVLMIVSLFVLPVIVGLGTSATVLETTKTVQSCGTCHVMDPFVNDLYNPESTTLAARHYKNGWISEYQCYNCHTTYGAHGTFEGKRDGFRHWLLFVTGTWEEPISFAGSYPNMNCTSCHSGTTAFRDVPSHRALSSKLRADEVSCTSCHGPPHPTPQERDDVPSRDDLERQAASTEIDISEMAKLMEALDGTN